MNLGNEFWLQIVIYALSMGSFGGVVITRLNYLEKKMDKHNSIQERMIRVEQGVKSAHHRIDEIKEL